VYAPSRQTPAKKANRLKADKYPSGLKKTPDLKRAKDTNARRIKKNSQTLYGYKDHIYQ
jgi:hypothetical protein